MPKILPADVTFIIIQLVVWEPKLCERTSELELAKGKFQEGIANASRAYREMYMLEWSRLLILHEVEDWKFAIGHNFAAHVRALILKEKALPSHAAVKAHLDFSRFELIHALTLDCHNDVGSSASLGIKGQWSYKKIIPNLPKKLKSLAILNAHGPDLQVIQKAIKQCKGLESLTLGRCTKFNRPDRCEFWRNFPSDHDSYFSGKGVDGYANALGTELQGIPNLKSIFVNVYLTDTKYLNETSATVAPTVQSPPSPTAELVTAATKRSSNSQTQIPLLAPMLLAPMNPKAAQSVKSKDQKDTEEAEETAADILFDCHPTLQTVGFISYWSKEHLGWSLRGRKEGNKSQSPYSGGKWDGIASKKSFESI